MPVTTATTDRLRDFVGGFTDLVDAQPEEPELLSKGTALLAALIAQDDWLPEESAVPSPDRYQQYLLHCDPSARFSVVSFVWGPGQKTPVHDHRVWGLIGMLRGAEVETSYVRAADGRFSAGDQRTLHPGDVGAVSPSIGDLHQVANAFDDRASISIHVYGADIGTVRRATYDAATGAEKPFVSDYSKQAVLA